MIVAASRRGANPVMRALRAIYRPLLERALTHRVVTLLAATAVLAGAVFVATKIGASSCRPLNEGDLLFMPVTDPSVSLTKHRYRARQKPRSRGCRGGLRGRKSRTADTSRIVASNMTETIVP